MKRQRGRNRKPGGGPSNANSANPNRSWDSQGPENIKVRGNAQTVYERYQQLARDAGASGDRVLAENYLQHAEHYFRVLRALQPQRPVSEIAARELSNQGYDIDFEDETGAQAAAFLAAQQAADRAAQGGDRNGQDRGDREPREGETQNRSEGQPREWRDRDNNRDRDRDNNRDRDSNRDRDNTRDRDQSRNDQQRDQPRNDGQDRSDTQRSDQPRAEGEEGGRRETRRERWERRREERNRRFEAEGGIGEAPTDEVEPAMNGDAVEAPTAQTYEAPADETPAPRTQRARRTRMPREDDAADQDAPAALPGFLTRSSAPAAPAAAAEPVSAGAGSDDVGETPAPKKRAPRRKAEPVAPDN